MQDDFHRVYHIQYNHRNTIVVEMKCQNCGNINTTEGDYFSPDDIVKFRTLYVCDYCLFDWMPQGGLTPYDNTASKWIKRAVLCEKERFTADIKCCYYETVNIQILKRQSEKSGKKRKKNCFYIRGSMAFEQ